MLDEISFLVQETFRDAEKLSNNIFSHQRKDIPKNTPGILFKLERKVSTFVIRIHPTRNLAREYKNILKHPGLYPSLRLEPEEGDTRDLISYFECESFEIAQALKEQISNKRFPFDEERIFNISDPGDSWWLNFSQNKIQINFNVASCVELDSTIKLGPLGESQRCSEIFNKLFGYFKQVFPISDYSSAHGHFSICCSDDASLMFKKFKDLLIHGETESEFWDYVKRLQERASEPQIKESFIQANNFILELATIRKFWKLIESKF